MEIPLLKHGMVVTINGLEVDPKSEHIISVIFLTLAPMVLNFCHGIYASPQGNLNVLQQIIVLFASDANAGTPSCRRFPKFFGCIVKNHPSQFRLFVDAECTGMVGTNPSLRNLLVALGKIMFCPKLSRSPRPRLISVSENQMAMIQSSSPFVPSHSNRLRSIFGLDSWFLLNHFLLCTPKNWGKSTPKITSKFSKCIETTNYW